MHFIKGDIHVVFCEFFILCLLATDLTHLNCWSTDVDNITCSSLSIRWVCEVWKYFKGTVPRDFRLLVFVHESVSPKHLIIPLRPIQIFCSCSCYFLFCTLFSHQCYIQNYLNGSVLLIQQREWHLIYSELSYLLSVNCHMCRSLKWT